MAHAKSTDPNVFILPDLGEGVHEAELIAWKVEVGQTVEEHEILAEMETDKALVEVPSPRAGTIKTLHGEAGEILHVGNPLVTYEGDGSSEPAPKPTPKKRGAKAAPEPSSNGAREEDDGTVVGQMSDRVAGMGAGDKALATPAVRRTARDMGVDINTIPGTGIGGRVTKRDVEAAASGASPARPPHTSARQDSRRPMPSAPVQPPQYQPAPQAHPQYPAQGYPPAPMQQYAPPGYMMIPIPMPIMPGYQQGGGIPHAPGYVPSQQRPIPDPAQRAQAAQGQDVSIPFRGVRRTIAGKLRESVDTAVHFTVVDEADVTALDAHRRDLAARTGQKLSFLPFVAQAVCRALSTRFGAMNATVDDDASEIVEHASVHLGIATDTDAGLMVPVIRDADRMDVPALSNAILETAASARDRSIARDRLVGSTFTISNVGSHAGKFATPVINYPEVAILAVGRGYDAVVVQQGQPAVGKLMPLSLACDHRVVDGATAALCLAEIVQSLQNPQSLV